MYIFLALFNKIFPLYLSIFLGYIAGKYLNTSRDMIARLMFYLINPIVFFNGVLNTQLDAGILAFPLLTFLISSAVCFITYHLTEGMWADNTRNILSYSAGTGNTGYFGLPIALLLFSDQGEGVYIMGALGIIFYESSVGFYTCARGIHPASECRKRLLRLPTLYAFLLALVLNLAQVPIPEVFSEFMVGVKGTFTVLGMMIIGLSLAIPYPMNKENTSAQEIPERSLESNRGLVYIMKALPSANPGALAPAKSQIMAGIRYCLPSLRLDWKFIGMSFFAKFFLWPCMALGIVSIDRLFFGFFDESVHDALLLISLVPQAVNSVIMASMLKLYPEKAASSVFLSTFFAIFYVPLMVAYFLQ